MPLYLGIYFTWIFIVIPISWFGGSLRARRRGEVAKFSAFTCYLGLFTTSLIWLVILCNLPTVISDAGLWPIL